MNQNIAPESQDLPTEFSVGLSGGAQSSIVGPSLIEQLERENAELKERNDALANAVVNSAEIIDELDQTRRQLAEARSAAENARKNTQRMADTIFDGTHASMMVLNAQFELISANRMAREMFGLDEMRSGTHLMRELTQRYRSEEHEDWFTALLLKSNDATHRLELYLSRGDSPGLKANAENQKLGQWIELSFDVLRGGLEGAAFLMAAHDVTQRKQMEHEFQFQALHDKVTGLPNRRFFVKRIESLLKNAGGDTSFSVCFLDLDDFKTVNDTLGHEAGDQLLVQVAERIERTICRDSLLARFGGDEFALLVPDQCSEKVCEMALRVVAELKRPFTINENTVHIGASIGMTRFPEDATEVNHLFQNADVAMYSAKEDGRSCFRPFTPALASGIRERQSLLQDLRATLNRNEIGLEYQPKWCMREERIAGCEALLRWRRNGVVVPASTVVEAAECSGLIFKLGDLVIETAVRQMAAWKHELSLDGRIAINVSSRQLVDPGFVNRFLQIVESLGVTPEIVELEITETAMIKDFNKAFEHIRKLKSAGVSMAIDDFGTGYSSLSYLKSFPVSTLKIDRSFVKDLPGDSKAVAVAQAILSLSHGLGLKVVAEGVETLEQYDFLKEAGCDQAQGFLFGPALSVEKFEEWFFKKFK